MPYCKHCGKKVNSRDTFCSKCGKAQRKKESESAEVFFDTEILKLIIIIGCLLFILYSILFLIPFPYTGYETYYEWSPYSVEQCKYHISLNPETYLNKGLDLLVRRLQEGKELTMQDMERLLQECQEVTKFKSIAKQRPVTKHGSLVEIMMMS
jgi:hypothetical protein